MIIRHIMVQMTHHGTSSVHQIWEKKLAERKTIVRILRIGVVLFFVALVFEASKRSFDPVTSGFLSKYKGAMM